MKAFGGSLLAVGRQLAKFWYVAAAVLIGAVFLGIYYGAYTRFGYQAAPGGDLFNHYLMVQDLRANGLPHFLLDYPKLFHLIVIGLMDATGKPFLKVLLYLVPVVMLGTALSVAWAVRVATRPQERDIAGLATMLLLLFVSSQPWQTLYDGGFPNIIAAGIWLPAFIACAIRFSQTKLWRYGAGAIAAALLVVITHQFTSGYLAVLLFASFAYFIRRIDWKMALLVAALVILFYFTPLAQPFLGILKTAVSFGPKFPWVYVVGRLANPHNIWTASQYVQGIGSSVVYFGIIGLIILLSRLRFARLSYGSYLLAVWLLMLLFGSQTPALVYPVRLARDLAVPLAAAGGICIGWCFQIGRSIEAKVAMRAGLVAVLAYGAYPQIEARWNRIADTYEPTIQYTNADQAAVDRIAGRPAMTINRPLLTMAGDNIKLGNMSVAPIGSEAEQYDESQLRLSQYALVESGGPEGLDGEAFIPILNHAGFTELARFRDNLKTVILFARQNWYD